MNSERRFSFRFLSCLLALCLLLTIIPATAESPATPTDLAPVEQLAEVTEPQQDPALPPQEPENPEEPAGFTEPDAEPPEFVESGDPEPEQPAPEEPEAGTELTEPEETDPFLAYLRAGARLYADRDCYRKQQILAEEAVVLVVKTAGNASEILYAYLDVQDQPVPGKAFARLADLRPLAEEETAAWQAQVHPSAVERLDFKLEPVTFGSEADAEPDQPAEGDEPEPRGAAENAEAGDTPEGGTPGEEPAEEEPAGEEPGEEESTGEEPAEEEPAGEPESEEQEEYVFAGGRLTADQVGEKYEIVAAPGMEATPTDLFAITDPSASYTNENVPADRNQNPYGTCWAFSAVGAMEIYLITNGYADTSIDLSEYYLAYFLYHTFPDTKPGGEGDVVEDVTGEDGYLNIGGNNFLAFRVLENLIGTVAETDVPYSGIPNPPSKYEPIAAQLTGAYLLNISSGNKDEIKQLIQSYGAVGASVCFPNEYNKACSMSNGTVGYNSSTHALYGTATVANHDILLVGWDDNYSRTNFISGLRPSGNGAWRVRNSWGSGSDFWVSYEDAAVQANEGTAYSAVSNDTTKTNHEEIPDFCYSYDKIPDSDSYEESTAWVLKRPSPVSIAQTFTVDGHEKILSVGAETGTANVTIGVKVQVEGDGNVYTGSVSAAYKGFYRIKLNTPAVIDSQKQVTVTVTYTHAAAGTEIIIPYEPGDRAYRLSSPYGTYRLSTHSGSGGFLVNGVMDSESTNADSCIKLYTKKEANVPVVTMVKLSCSSPSIPAAQTITLNNARINAKYQLKAAVTADSGADTTIRWTSTNPAVATVSTSGLVTVHETGKTNIVASSVSGARAVCQLSTPDVKPESIQIEGFSGATVYTISNTNAGNFTFGKTLTIWAMVNPSYVTEPEVSWRSDNTAVLSLEDYGTESGKPRHVYGGFVCRGNGSATITVTSKSNPSVKASVKIIIDLVTGVQLNTSSCELTEGQTSQLYATVLPTDAKSRAVNWSSSNSGVVTVDGNGVLRGVKPGKATVTVTTVSGGKTASCAVTVNPKDPIEAFVYRMYRVCLLREPDEEGLRNWVNALRTRQRTGAQIASGFYNSKEMKNRGLSNAEFVIRAYEGILGRTPDAAGLADWSGRLDNGVSYAYIVAGFTNSQEFKGLCAQYGIEKGTYKSTEPRDQNRGITAYVARLYTKMLGRSFDPNGLNNWCQKILDDPTKAKAYNVAVSGFLHSQEFLGKRLSNEEFVKVCYRTFLGREPDPSGLKNWIGRLAGGDSRDKVAAGFANSKEFTNLMAQYGLK